MPMSVFWGHGPSGFVYPRVVTESSNYQSHFPNISLYNAPRFYFQLMPTYLLTLMYNYEEEISGFRSYNWHFSGAYPGACMRPMMATVKEEEPRARDVTYPPWLTVTECIEALLGFGAMRPSDLP